MGYENVYLTPPSSLIARAWATDVSPKTPTAVHALRTRKTGTSPLGRFTFTATYAAVTLCQGNGHDEVVAIRCVGAR
jgi:hypothetical protein